MSDGAHDHPLIEGLITNEANRAQGVEATLSSNLAALMSRVAALEPGGPPPPPPPPPPPGQVVVQASTLAEVNAKMPVSAGVDRIQVLAGDKIWTVGDQPIPFAWADRTSRPLTIEFLPGAVLKGSGTELGDGVISPTSAAKAITFENTVIDGAKLAACGALSIRYGSKLTFRNTIWKNLIRGPSGTNPAAFKTWAIYIWGSPSDITIEDFDVQGTGRTVHSGFQIDDEANASTSRPKNIIIRRGKLSHLCFGFYENLPATGVVLDTIALLDVGGRGTSVNMHLATGTYKGITKDASSDPFSFGKLVPG